MKTRLNYLLDAQRLEMPMIHARSILDSDKRMTGIVTDVSPFYAQGGGQPGDKGVIEAGSRIFFISNVRHVDGDVVHELTTPDEPLSEGTALFGRVDQSVRALHARLHTAGELVYAAAIALNPTWSVDTAIHFPENASVTFDVGQELLDTDTLKAALEERLQMLVASDFKVEIRTGVDGATACALTGKTHDQLPAGTKFRIVSPLSGFYCLCMGTHVNRTAEIGAVAIRKIKKRAGRLIVSYSVS